MMQINEIENGVYAPSSLASAEAFAEMHSITEPRFSVNKEGVVKFSNINPGRKERVEFTFLGGETVHYVLYAKDSGFFAGSGKARYDDAMRRVSMFGLDYLVS